MARSTYSAMDLPMRVPTHGPQTEISPRGNRNRPHPYNSVVPGAEDFHCVGATSYPHFLHHTTPCLDVAHTYHYYQLSHQLASAPHHVEPDLDPQLVYQSYALLSVGSEPSDDTPTDYINMGFSQPSELYSAWSSFPPSRDLPPNPTCDVSPPTLHHSTLDPTLYPDSPCLQSRWSTEVARVGSMDEDLPAPRNYNLPTFPPPTFGPSPHPQFENTSEPYIGTLDASYPCLWAEDGVICNVMVQATRSHMNRHLHAYHGFGGSDTRQTRCCWAGCGAMMQQGSIARHMVTCHLQAKVTCPMCFKKLSRQDVISKHQRVCPAAITWR